MTARARDAAGNTTLSAPVTVNVANASSFQNEVLATGFNLPTAIKFLPDGRMLVAELAGTIKVLPPPYTQADPTPFLQLTNVGSADRPSTAGIYRPRPRSELRHQPLLLHLLHRRTPDTRPPLALHGQCHADRHRRRAANSSSTRIRRTRQRSQNHHGGAITFGNDGKIYLTTGDHFQGTPAQDLTSPRGKILRINPDGTVPTDNPFYDGAGPNYDAIWALGLRNPYRAYYDAPTGRLLIGDVGGNDYSTAIEELDLGVRGANYGWPNVEGTSSNPAYTNPIYSYPHNGRDAASRAASSITAPSSPAAYQGSYFFADYAQNWIKRLTFDANGNVNGVFNFEPPDGSPDGPYGDIVYLTEGPDGALYYVDLGFSDTSGDVRRQQDPPDQLRRVGNQPPVAVGLGQPDVGPDAARRQLLQRRLVRSRRPAADLFVDLRRRHHLDGGQPDAHLHAAGPVLRPGSPSPTESNSTLSTPSEHQRRQSADGDHLCRRPMAASSGRAT